MGLIPIWAEFVHLIYTVHIHTQEEEPKQGEASSHGVLGAGDQRTRKEREKKTLEGFVDSTAAIMDGGRVYFDFPDATEVFPPVSNSRGLGQRHKRNWRRQDSSDGRALYRVSYGTDGGGDGGGGGPTTTHTYVRVHLSIYF